MVNISSNLKTLIKTGYDVHCQEIKYLVDKRINKEGTLILEDYIKEARGYVDSYCANHNIDLINVITGEESEKEKLGINLIENEIMAMIETKSKYDSELKSLSLKTERILNGIENAPWLALFGSPNNLAWFVKRTDKVIESLNPKDEWTEFIIDTIENIKNNWVDPQSVKPDLVNYWALVNLEVDQEVKDRVVFPSGN